MADFIQLCLSYFLLEAVAKMKLSTSILLEGLVHIIQMCKKRGSHANSGKHIFIIYCHLSSSLVFRVGCNWRQTWRLSNWTRVIKSEPCGDHSTILLYKAASDLIFKQLFSGCTSWLWRMDDGPVTDPACLPHSTLQWSRCGTPPTHPHSLFPICLPPLCLRAGLCPSR